MLETPLRFAFPGGGKRAETQVRKLFKASGTDINREDGAVLVEGNLSTGPDFVGHFMRPREIPEIVGEGFFDVGFVGLDWILEKRKLALKVAEFPFRDAENKETPRVVAFTSLLLTSGDVSPDPRTIKPGTVVVSEYPRITEEYFERLGIRVDVRFCSGSAEALVPYPWEVGACVTETGAAFDKNKLVVYQGPIVVTPLCMIASECAMKNVQKKSKILKVKDVLLAQCAVGGL